MSKPVALAFYIPGSYGGGGMKHLLHFEICVVEHTERMLCILNIPGSIMAFLDKTGISIWNLVELLSISTIVIELDEQMIWHHGILS